jgi:hypothetical protein
VERLPVGTVLTDGVYRFTATAGNTVADITGWCWGTLSITPPTDFYGSIDMLVRARSTEAGNSDTADTTQVLTVTVEQGSYTSPLVIDLNGNGIQTTTLSSSIGTFDLLNTGSAIRSGWISSGDAFLAIDSNGNGVIDNRSELFGGNDGEGFARLAGFDSNGDGRVDANDLHFSELLVWQDLNGDHRTEAGELKMLSEAGIGSLDVNYRLQPQLQNGNWLKERGEVTMTDGRTLAMADVYFETATAQAPAATTAPKVAIGSNSASITVQSLLQVGDPIVVKPLPLPNFPASQRLKPTEGLHRLVASAAPPRQSQTRDSAVRAIDSAHWTLDSGAPGPARSDNLESTEGTPAPVIDWTAHRAPSAHRSIDKPVHQPWMADFLGVSSKGAVDLGALTGLRVRIPAKPDGASTT